MPRTIRRATQRCSPLRLAVLFFLLSGAASADVVYLKNGKTLHGEVIREDDDVVVIKVPYGEVKLKQSDVVTIERQTPFEYRLELGRQLLQQGNHDRAVRAFEEAFAGNKSNVEARRMLANAYAMQGKHYQKVSRFADAREAFEKLHKLDPEGAAFPHAAADWIKEIAAQEKNAGTLLVKARGLAAAQEWAQAIAAFEETVNFTPDARAAVSAEMAQCYVQRAIEHGKSGRPINAAADVEAALRLDPRLADGVERFYVSCALPGILSSLQRGDMASAQVDLKRVMGFAPANKSVLYVAGRVEEALGRIPAAADFYARAQRSRVGNATAEYTAGLRLALEKELGIQADRWKIDTEIARADEFAASTDGPAQKTESDNFTIVHYNEALARQVSEAAEYNRARIMGEMNLNQPWKAKVKIYIHRTQAEYTARTGQPEWTGGFSKFTGSGDMQVHSWQTSPRLLKSVLPHEITHLIVYGALPENNALPRSLHEGFAVLMEPRFRQDYFSNFLRLRLKSQDFISLAELLAVRDYPRDPEFFYAEGYSIVDYVVQLKGLPSMVGLLKNAATAAQVQSELLRISGARSVEDLESDWKKWITKTK